MDESIDYEREDLIDGFRRYLHDPDHKDFFDHSDIVEIFDYAGDMGDDYIRVEALLYAARYFPDSKEMEQRRLVYYSETSPRAANAFIQDHDSGEKRQSTIQRLIALQISRPDHDSAIAALEKILAEQPKMDDEETIRFVAAVNECDCLDWLADNLERVATKSNSRACLVYELAMYTYESEQYEAAVPLFEKLVTEKPFALSYWELLLDSQTKSNAPESDIVDTMETMLAMDPDNLPALKAKAQKAYADGADTEVLADIIKRIPDDMGTLYMYIRALLDHGQKEQAAKYIEERLCANPKDYKAHVANLCVAGSRAAIKAIAKEFANEEVQEGVTPQMWYEALQSINKAKDAIAGMALMVWISKHYEELPEWWTKTLVCNAFNVCKFKYVVRAIEADPSFFSTCDIVQYTMVCFAYAKTYEYDIAFKMSCGGVIRARTQWPDMDLNDPRWKLLYLNCLGIMTGIISAIDDARDEDRPVRLGNPFEVYAPKD